MKLQRSGGDFCNSPPVQVSLQWKCPLFAPLNRGQPGVIADLLEFLEAEGLSSALRFLTAASLPETHLAPVDEEAEGE